MKKRFLFLALVALVGFCQPAAAQTRADRSETQVVRPPTAEDTRDDLRAILDKYPNSVAEILRRDPSLMARADYMAAYPDLENFLQQHPEIPRNVEYYLEGFASWQNPRRIDPSFEALGALLGGMAAVFLVIIFVGVITWLVRVFIQHRRWLRASHVQAEVHTKLMDRLTTNEELLNYMQSPAGRRFLEAAPLRPETEGPQLSAPIGSIIWSMMAGVVLTVLGVGFRYAGNFVKDDAHDAFVVVGVIILALGIGFMVASLMGFALSSRLGLFPPKPAPESTNA